MATASMTLFAAAMLLAGSEWGLDGNDKAFVQFGDGRVSGHGGCNRFGGSYTQDETRLSIGPLMATRMACAPEVMSAEQEFMDALQAARHVEATHLLLTLKDESGGVLLTLKRRDFD